MNADIYVADGDYIRDIEINDLRNRYTLTKGSTQKMVIVPIILADSIQALFRKQAIVANIHFLLFFPFSFVVLLMTVT